MPGGGVFSEMLLAIFLRLSVLFFTLYLLSFLSDEIRPNILNQSIPAFRTEASYCSSEREAKKGLK